MQDFTQLHIGFASEWLKYRPRTWSGTPYSLFNALQHELVHPICDIDVSLPDIQLYAHKILTGRLHEGKLISKYRHTHLHLRPVEKKLHRIIASLPEKLDAVLTIGDIGTTIGKYPFYIYLDMTIDYVMENHGRFPPGENMFSFYSYRNLLRRKKWQDRVFRECAGIFSMSKLMADHIVEHSGVERSRVHVVHAGNNMLKEDDDAPVEKTNRPCPPGKKGRVLFVGRDFLRKGGDLVLAAFEYLAREYSNEIRLTIVGPPQWPQPGPVPEYVEFVGDIPYDQVRSYYQQADLFCLPSRYEGFGLVFTEALSYGVPCIGRRAFAMPEIISHGVDGYLIEKDDPVELASLIIKTLEDETMQARVKNNTSQYRKYYSWNRVARDILSVIHRQTQ